MFPKRFLSIFILVFLLSIIGVSFLPLSYATSCPATSAIVQASASASPSVCIGDLLIAIETLASGNNGGATISVSDSQSNMWNTAISVSHSAGGSQNILIAYATASATGVDVMSYGCTGVPCGSALTFSFVELIAGSMFSGNTQTCVYSVNQICTNTLTDAFSAFAWSGTAGACSSVGGGTVLTNGISSGGGIGGYGGVSVASSGCSLGDVGGSAGFTFPTETISFAQSGISSPSNPQVLSLNGTLYTLSQMPVSFTYAYGNPFTVSYGYLQNSGGYTFSSISGCGLSSKDGTLTNPSTCTAAATYAKTSTTSDNNILPASLNQLIAVIKWLIPSMLILMLLLYFGVKAEFSPMMILVMEILGMAADGVAGIFLNTALNYIFVPIWVSIVSILFMIVLMLAGAAAGNGNQ